MTEDTRTTPPWQGFHHVTLLTRDLDATAGFYREVLGMHVAGLGEAGPLGRHCVVQFGTGPLRGLHFIERRDAELHTQPELLRTQPPFFADGAFQHLALALPDRAAGLALRERLRERGLVLTDVIDTGPISNLMFSDNNGILLEATWPRS